MRKRFRKSEIINALRAIEVKISKGWGRWRRVVVLP